MKNLVHRNLVWAFPFNKGQGDIAVLKATLQVKSINIPQCGIQVSTEKV